MSQEQCVKGVNWGEINLDDKQLLLRHNKQNLLKIPIKKIINSNTQKNDIVIQLSTEDCDTNDDMLCEVRFYVPPNLNELMKQQKQDKKKNEGGNDPNKIQEESDSDEEPEQKASSFLQSLQEDILGKAKIGQSSGDSIASIHDVPLVVPRGKYNMDFFRNSIRFHGSTYQFTTEYKSIQKLFMLPMIDEINISLVIGLEKPLKQGQTTYNYMVMQFRKDVEGDVKLKYSKEKLTEIGWLNIQEQYQGPLYDIVCKLFMEITGVRVIIPKNFKSKNGSLSLRCSVGPHQGYLFPLEKSLIYISKPVCQFKHEDIREVIFQRISQSNLNKLFDMKIVAKNSSQLFAGIDRGELDNLSDYFQSRKIKVSRIQEDVVTKVPLAESDGDDEVDDDDSRQLENQKRKNIRQQQQINNNNIMDSDEDDEDFEVNPNQQDESDDSNEDISDEEINEPQKQKKNH